VIAQNKLQVVECDVGFLIKNQRCETRLLSLQELVKGAAMVAKFGILAL